MNRSPLLPSPLTKLKTAVSDTVELYIKREDLIHPLYGGNKWRKLKYNIEAYKTGGYKVLVTFGGPFSNHIAATAAICNVEGIPCVGLIRGSYVDAHNPTLLAAQKNGMQLIHLTKEAYRHKEASSEVQAVLANFKKPFLVPEGGSNELALKGVAELMEEVYEGGETFDHIVLAAGTGTTAAGIIASAQGAKVTVINALKNSGLQATIEQKLARPHRGWEVNNDFHFGGFAKTTDELVAFIHAFYASEKIPLDPIYNGKALYATLQLIKENYFPAGTRILYIHTGGLQGITAYNYRNRGKGIEIKHA